MDPGLFKYFESTLTIFYRIYQIIESVSIFPKLDSWSSFDGILLLPKLCVMLGQLCFNWCLWQQEKRLADHYQLPLFSPSRGTPPISPPLVFPPTGRNIVGVPSWWRAVLGTITRSPVTWPGSGSSQPGLPAQDFSNIIQHSRAVVCNHPTLHIIQYFGSSRKVHGNTEDISESEC